MSRQPRDVEFTRSDFGGGWIVPKTERARDMLAQFFDGPATPIMALCFQEGYIVEPYEMGDLGEAVQDAGLSVEA